MDCNNNIENLKITKTDKVIISKFNLKYFKIDFLYSKIADEELQE